MVNMRILSPSKHHMEHKTPNKKLLMIPRLSVFSRFWFCYTFFDFEIVTMELKLKSHLSD